MASSILTGERRLGSARRGGMTVLGKVTVPKPVNLPSQRLENHGLDPNVEIVPKGTLSWGSRSSAAGVNAWGSTSLPSPSTEGSSGSPSLLNARPSSGGSGTRPSTSGSDKSHEPALSSAWGPSSRPSSASGALASSHTSLALSRPRSAEPRPGSSQLSRFAEPLADNSVARWGLTTSERLGAASSKMNGFTLSSGDFPSLGSDKNPELQMRQGHSSQGRPASSGAAAARERSEMSSTEDGSRDANTERGSVNTWKRDNSLYQVGAPPGAEKWPRDPQQAQLFPNMNIPHHQFDLWHAAPPVRSPSEGSWFRGGPPVGPYGPTGPPGGYPLDPSAYFHSQMAARPVSYPQAVPRPGSGSSGYPNIGEMYRPHKSDSYMVPNHPVIAFRPGVYPAPVPCDDYYGPSREGLSNTNECDVSAMGKPTGFGAYNRYPNQQSHPDSSNFHGRPGGYGPNPAVAKEQMESGLGHNSHQGPYKVLLKQHADLSEKDAEDKRGHSEATNMACFNRMNSPGVPTGENNWGTDASNDEPMDFSKPAFAEDDASKPTKDCGSVASASVVRNEREKTHSAEVVDDSSLKKPEIAAEHTQLLPGVKKISTLIDKIEGLNSKARASDGRYDVGHASTKEKTKQFKCVNVEVDPSMKYMAAAVSTEKSSTSDMLMRSSNKTEAPTEERSSKLSCSVIPEPKQLELQASGVRMSEIGEKACSQNQKRSHNIQNRADYRTKGRFNTQEGEEWRRKAPGADSASTTVSLQNPGASSPDMHVQNHHDATQEGPQKHEDLSPYAASSADPSNCKAQRAKMKEKASQRAKQLQREEEERAREQKAKAQAKLEDLNRRTQSESSTQIKLEQPFQHKTEETSQSNAPSKTDISSSGEVPGRGSSSRKSSQSARNTVNLDVQTQSSEKSVNWLGGSTNLPIPVEVSSHALQGPMFKPANSSAFLPLDNARGTDPSSQRTTVQVFDNGVIKQKQMGHKKKPNISQEKILGDQQTITGGTRIHGNMEVDAIASSGQSSLVNCIRNTDDASLVFKKKNNRSAKSKHKPDEPLVGTAGIPVSAPMEENPANALAESGKRQALEPVLEGTLSQTRISKVIAEGADSHNVVVSTERGLSQLAEETHGRANQWKPQPPRWTPKSTHVITPVRLPSKSVLSEEASQIINGEVNNSSFAKNMHGVQNNLKNKRAEMERYVPKPVAKELSQLGNSQQPASVCHTQTISDLITSGKANVSHSAESIGQHSLVAGKMGVAPETKNGENKHNNRHGKTQSSWRQRGSVESSHAMQMSHEVALPSNEQSKDNQKAFDLHQPSKPDMSSPKGLAKYSENWSNNPMPTEPAGASFMKDHGVPEKGKKPPQKVPKGGGNNHTAVNEDLHSGMGDKTENKSLANKSTEPDGKSAVRNESQGGGEPTVSHWQPKSQAAYPAQSRQGSGANNKVMGGQRNAGQVARSPEKEFFSQGTENFSQRADKGWNAKVQPPHHIENQKTNVTETTNVRVQETRKERKGQEQVSAANMVDHDLRSGADSHQEQPVSFGQRRHGQQNGRFHRGPEAAPYGGSWGEGQETIKQQMPGTGDRRKHNSRLEYQPVRFQKPGDSSQQNPSIGEEIPDGFQGGRGSRYRERDQNHGRRGSHFYGHNGGGAGTRVAVSYGNGE